MHPRHRAFADEVILGLVVAVLLAGGCHGRREPSCLPSYERRALTPLDESGKFILPGSSADDRPSAPPSEIDRTREVSTITSPSAERSAAVVAASFSDHHADRSAATSPAVVLAEAVPEGQPQPPSTDDVAARLRVPPGLPGAEAPPIVAPPFTTTDDPQRKQALQDIYFPLPPISGSPPSPPVEGEALDLGSLQALAMANSPAIRVAAAQVESSRGLAIQAGLYPNPRIGYEADTVNTANTNGYQGGFVEQTFVTGGKLRLARAAADVDYRNAQVALRRTQIDIATAVRKAYFEALVAREKLRIQSTLAAFTEEVFRTQVRLTEAGEAAVYEPLQLRVYVIQSRAAVVQAEQRFAAARRQLAAALGLPQLPLGELIGRPDMPIPVISYDAAAQSMLTTHTDLAIARNNVVQAQRRLELARVTPLPNIGTYLAVQQDDTFKPGGATYNLQIGAPIPIFDPNTGNIISTQAKLYEAEQMISQTENQLLAQLADAYSRYESNRRFVQDFQPLSLQDQVRTYRGIYERYRSDSRGLQFVDVFVAQQTLSTLLNQYIDLLGAQWQAVVDVAELLQIDDIYLLGEAHAMPPIPELLPPSDSPAGSIDEVIVAPVPVRQTLPVDRPNG